MKQLYLLTALMIILASCKREDPKKLEFINFLNNTAKKLDKKKLEIISLNAIDTIFITDYHTVQMERVFESYDPESEGTDTTIDTLVSESTTRFSKDSIDWLSYPFSRKLHEAIRFETPNYTDEFNLPNGFMNSIVITNYKEFKDSILNNKDFQRKLHENLVSYDGYEALTNLEIYNNNIRMERLKSKEIHSFMYRCKYRMDGILFQTDFLFNKQGKIIEYAQIED
ncbi:MAG: hypothetical protein V4687_06765 [Bacteroidota bacterium]